MQLYQDVTELPLFIATDREMLLDVGRHEFCIFEEWNRASTNE